MRRVLWIMAAAVLVILVGVETAQAVTISASVTWGPVQNATAYLVERQEAQGAWTSLGSPTTNAYTDVGLTVNTGYCYRISATNAYGASAPSPAACATSGGPPNSPGNVTVTVTTTP